ncbi:MAG: SDR family NAD(P)-dependent oxidoreductase, partial [Actinomycetota bacterium]|nr:SDR family NAD(P)-dependent oxidoreductase [Actinomycetota bacterium]
MRIEDSVVAVTGGASGLGEAVARRCIDQGAASVAILDVNADAATSLASELGDRAFALPCDVRQPSDVTQAMSTMAEKFGRLNLAVSCAGVGWAERTLAKDGSPADLDAYRRIIEINLI